MNRTSGNQNSGETMGAIQRMSGPRSRIMGSAGGGRFTNRPYGSSRNALCGSFSKRGVSFIEITFAVLILGILVGPVLYSVGTMNRGTTTTIYEMMAAQYAWEILDQVRALPVNSILEGNGANSLSQFFHEIILVSGPKPVNKQEVFPGVFFLVSPLPPEIYKKRTLKLDNDSKMVNGTTVNLLRATVKVEWEVPGMKGPRHYSACTYLMEP